VIDRIQSIAKVLGAYGCNFFSDLKIAEIVSGEDIDAFLMAQWAIANGCLGATDSFIPSEAAHLAIMRHATGFDWGTRLEGITYVCKSRELEKLQYGMGTYDHYVVGTGYGGVRWDSCGNLIMNTPTAVLKAKRIYWKI
jgi:hypothetical protein